MSESVGIPQLFLRGPHEQSSISWITATAVSIQCSERPHDGRLDRSCRIASAIPKRYALTIYGWSMLLPSSVSCRSWFMRYRVMSLCTGCHVRRTDDTLRSWCRWWCSDSLDPGGMGRHTDRASLEYPRPVSALLVPTAHTVSSDPADFCLSSSSRL